GVARVVAGCDGEVELAIHRLEVTAIPGGESGEDPRPRRERAVPLRDGEGALDPAHGGGRIAGIGVSARRDLRELDRDFRRMHRPLQPAESREHRAQAPEPQLAAHPQDARLDRSILAERRERRLVPAERLPTGGEGPPLVARTGRPPLPGGGRGAEAAGSGELAGLGQLFRTAPKTLGFGTGENRRERLGLARATEQAVPEPSRTRDPGLLPLAVLARSGESPPGGAERRLPQEGRRLEDLAHRVVRSGRGQVVLPGGEQQARRSARLAAPQDPLPAALRQAEAAREEAAQEFLGGPESPGGRGDTPSKPSESTLAPSQPSGRHEPATSRSESRPAPWRTTPIRCRSVSRASSKRAPAHGP